MGIDRIMLVLERQNNLNINSDWDVFVAWNHNRVHEAIKLAMELRGQGKTVKLATITTTEVQALELQKINNCNFLNYVK